MKEAKSAAFGFEKYQINNFSYNAPTREYGDSISIGFAPSGLYNTKDKKFTMSLNFIAFLGEDKNDKHELINVKLEASFIFKEAVSFDNIPNYFYRNSLGIVYPYLRAFISTLTFQANLSSPVILPILNLVALEEEFKKNSSVL